MDGSGVYNRRAAGDANAAKLASLSNDPEIIAAKAAPMYDDDERHTSRAIPCKEQMKMMGDDSSVLTDPSTGGNVIASSVNFTPLHIDTNGGATRISAQSLRNRSFSHKEQMKKGLKLAGEGLKRHNYTHPRTGEVYSEYMHHENTSAAAVAPQYRHRVTHSTPGLSPPPIYFHGQPSQHPGNYTSEGRGASVPTLYGTHHTRRQTPPESHAYHPSRFGDRIIGCNTHTTTGLDQQHHHNPMHHRVDVKPNKPDRKRGLSETLSSFQSGTPPPKMSRTNQDTMATPPPPSWRNGDDMPTPPPPRGDNESDPQQDLKQKYLLGRPVEKSGVKVLLNTMAGQQITDVGFLLGDSSVLTLGRLSTDYFCFPSLISFGLSRKALQFQAKKGGNIVVRNTSSSDALANEFQFVGRGPMIKDKVYTLTATDKILYQPVPRDDGEPLEKPLLEISFIYPQDVIKIDDDGDDVVVKQEKKIKQNNPNQRHSTKNNTTTNEEGGQPELKDYAGPKGNVDLAEYNAALRNYWDKAKDAEFEKLFEDIGTLNTQCYQEKDIKLIGETSVCCYYGKLWYDEEWVNIEM